MFKTANIKERLYIVALELGAAIGVTSVGLYLHGDLVSRPNPDSVESGYVMPQDLEIRVQDADKNGLAETVLQYQNKNYLLKVDTTGKPVVVEYKVESAK